MVAALVELLGREDTREDGHARVELHGHQSGDDGLGDELVTIDAAVHHKPGGNDAVEASGIGKRSNVQRQLEGAWYLECFDLGVAIDPLKKPDAGLGT